MTQGEPEHTRTIDAALADARAAGLPRHEAMALLTASSGMRREQLLTRGDTPLSFELDTRFAQDCARRLAGEPLAYLLGEREFFGLALHVGPAVLIPRPETELLVEFALEHAAPGTRILDLGTGSGAIAVAIAHHCAGCEVAAVDVSPAALAIAATNNERWANARVRFYLSDWFASLPQERWQIIVSNPPYIAAGDPHLTSGDLRHEPLSALTDGGDGLLHVRHIIATAPAFLSEGGWLALEHGYDQAHAVRALLDARGFEHVTSRRDLAGIERISIGQWLDPHRL